MGRVLVKPVVEALLSGILDYAGLFPPAALPMPEAVRRYADYRDSADAWLLGRFVVSASRLEELDATLDEIAEREPIEHPWQVSAIVGTDVAADAAAIARFNECQAHARPRPACVDGVDVKAASGAEVSRLVEMFPSHSGTWFEVAAGPSLDDVLREVAFVGAGAKLRAGGVTADAFPPAEAVARFMLSCARAGARWKATAGLHHAWRGPHPVTYEADSELAVMHGFLNVFLAAVLANRAAQQDDAAPALAEAAVEADAEIVALLAERDPTAFAWDDAVVRWRAHGFGVEEIRSVRERFARSFGSCSFEEPVSELRMLGLMGAAPTV